MQDGSGKSKRNIWLWIANVVVIAAMVVTLALYATSNSQREASDSREEMLKATANVSDLVRLYFISQHRNLYNHRQYISPSNGDSLAYDEALAYLQKANADDTVHYQIIDPETYCGDSLMGGAIVYTDYTFDTYASIREACDLVATGEAHNNVIRSTSVFANPSDGAAASIALYTDIDLRVGTRDRHFALLAVIRTENLVYSGLPSLGYEGAGACIIDDKGDYIVKDDRHFRNSENFRKFLRVYNALTYPQMDAIAEDMAASGAGILEYDNYRGEACYYPYHVINGTDGWYYVASVPVASAARSGVDYLFALILLSFLGVLIALNVLWMRRLNSLLRSNVRHLDEARKAADAANDAKTFFLAHMSHEMRTPLNAIIGMGALAQGKTDDPEVESLLEKMGSASEHLLGIINDVLDISKIGEGKLMLHNEPFSIEEMIDALTAIYDISASEKGISLVINRDIPVRRYLIGDQLRLRQVMTNLISNAIKYNSSGGFVKVDIRQLGDAAGDSVRINFRIEDNGFGISEDKQKDVFEPFLRDYTDRTRAIAGTGLGLAISSQLVAAMGGEIKLQSELDVGSVFYFELTFALGDVIEPKEEDEKPHWTSESLKGLNILVVEDNAMNAFVFENLLKKVGARVALATNGREALDKVQSADERFDIILMDILMPVMDGYAATRQIRRLDDEGIRNIPIIALSANAFNEDIEASLAQGMQAHLAKPVDLDAMYQTILRFVGRRGG